MTNTRTYGLFNETVIDERNDGPLLIALVATVVAWLTMWVVALA